MAQSKYDTDGDGVCDAPECSNILAVTDEADPYPEQAALIQQNMEPIGLTFDVKSLRADHDVHQVQRPEAHVAICLAPAWGKDFPDGYTFADPLFGSAAIFPSCCNYELLGASAGPAVEGRATPSRMSRRSTTRSRRAKPADG